MIEMQLPAILLPIIKNKQLLDKERKQILSDKNYVRKSKTIIRIPGGRSSGKSWGIAIITLLFTMESKLRVVFCRETAKAQDRSSKKLLSDLIYSYKLPGFTITEDSIKHLNGSEITFLGLKGCSKEDARIRIKGLEGVNILVIDESESLTKELLEIIDPTVRVDDVLVFFTYNPYLDPDAVTAFYPQTNDEVMVIEVNYYNNPFCPSRIRRIANRLKEADYEAWAHIYDGKPKQQGDRCLLTRLEVQEAMSRKVNKDTDMEVISCDVSRFGTDTTVAWKRQGMQVTDGRVWRKRDGVEIARNLLLMATPKTKYIILDDTGLGCLTDNNQILTVNEGWKNASELKVGDLVYSKDTNGVVIESVINNAKVENDTDILRINDSIEFSYGHFLPYKSRKEYQFKLSSWNAVTDNKTFALDTDFIWEVPDRDIFFNKRNIKMPNGGTRDYGKELNIKGSTFCRFLGWYLSEGCLDKTMKSIKITQVKETHIKEIEDTLTEIFGKVKRKKNDFFVYNKEVYDYLHKECYKNDTRNCYNKTIPDFVRHNSKNNIKEFLLAFRKGDGTLTKAGVSQYFTSSKYLLNGLSEMLNKLNTRHGYVITAKAGSTSEIFGRTITRTADVYGIYEISEHIWLTPKKKEVRKGTVYNININSETKLFYTRMKGSSKSFWTHNCGVTDHLNHFKKTPEFNLPNLKIIPINFAESPKDKEKYPNITSEMWFEFQKLIGFVGMVYDKELLHELTTRKYDYEKSTQRRIMETKKEYKTRGFKSPDKSDSMLLLFYKHQRYAEKRYYRVA